MTTPAAPKKKSPFSLWTIFGLICGAIAIGTLLGSQIYLHRHALKNEVVPPRHLEVLAIKGLFSQPLIEGFQKRTGIIVKVTECATPEELWSRFTAQPTKDHEPFDVATLFSYQMRLAEQLARLKFIDTRKIRHFYDTSPDFIESIASDSLTNPAENKRNLALVSAMPLLWGAESLFYNSTKTKAPESWAEALKANHNSTKVGVPRSVVDLDWLARLTDPLAATPQANVSRSSHPAEPDKTLAALLANIRLSKDFLSPADLLSKNKPPVVLMMSHGQAAFAPFKESEWKSAPVSEGELLWTLSVVIDKEAKNIDSADAFLSDLLRVESATQLIESYKQASCNRQLESANIDLRLKPSYLRQLPLDKLSFVKEVSRANELRATLDATVERANDDY